MDYYKSTMQGSDIDNIVYALVMAVLVLAVTVFCVFCREERDGTVSLLLFNIPLLVLFYDMIFIVDLLVITHDLSGYLFHLERTSRYR